MARKDISIDMIPCDLEEAYLSGVQTAINTLGGHYATYGNKGLGEMYVAISRNSFTKIEATEAWTEWAESQYVARDPGPDEKMTPADVKQDLVKQVLDDFDEYPIPENWTLADEL